MTKNRRIQVLLEDPKAIVIIRNANFYLTFIIRSFEFLVISIKVISILGLLYFDTQICKYDMECQRIYRRNVYLQQDNDIAYCERVSGRCMKHISLLSHFGFRQDHQTCPLVLFFYSNIKKYIT